MFAGLCSIVVHPDVTIRLKASYRDDLETGGSVWHAGLVLARYLCDHPELVRNKNIIEIGCGCGLVGIVAACLGV